jgi:hypothetical protein
VAVDAQLSIPTVRGLRLVLGGDNLFDQQPAGWPVVVGRRLRLGIDLEHVFRD